MDKLRIRRTMDEGRKTKKIFWLLAGLIFYLSSSFILLPSSIVYAEIPHVINYQGRLTDRDGKPITGSRQVTFNIYDDKGATIWTEIHPNILVEKGVFSVLLGSVNGNLPAFDKPYWLGIRVGTDEEMQPRQQITAVGYALRAEKAESAEGTIKASGGLIIETRTSDPPSPVTGQIWFREDL
ncbi:MAG: hypothetical protein WC628_06510 [Candidatus Omnitrophota bacterium]